MGFGMMWKVLWTVVWFGNDCIFGFWICTKKKIPAAISRAESSNQGSRLSLQWGFSSGTRK
jgi:hypothetical protein